MADVTANLQAATTASTPYALPTNLPLLSAFLSFALAQFLKIFTSWCVRLSHFHHRVSFPLCLAHLSSVQSLFPSSVRSKHCDEKSARLSFFFFQDPASYFLFGRFCCKYFVFSSTIRVSDCIFGQEFSEIWVLGFEIKVRSGLLVSVLEIRELRMNESREKTLSAVLIV